MHLDENLTMANDPLRTCLCDEYGCEYPIVAFAHTCDVIAAASNASAIGVLGCSTHTIEELKADIAWIKERVGDRPFGVDITIPSSYVRGNQEELEQEIPQSHRDWVDQLARDNDIPEPKGPPPEDVRLRGLRDTRTTLAIMIEERIPIFASGMGSPAFILDGMHEAGVKVWGLIGLARQATRELEAGLDLVIAQGQDSAGHTGRIGTFSIVPEVVELAREHDTPILAAGGVTTGRHIVAAVALGAVGVWTGTMWQATHKSATEMWAKQKLLGATAQDAWVSTAGDGKRSCGVRNRYLEAWESADAPQHLPMPLQGLLNAKLRQSIEEHELRDWQGVAAGQGVGFVRELKPTRQVVLDLMEEAYDAIDAMQLDPAPSCAASRRTQGLLRGLTGPCWKRLSRSDPRNASSACAPRAVARPT